MSGFEFTKENISELKEEEKQSASSDMYTNDEVAESKNGAEVAGVILVVLGVVFLLNAHLPSFQFNHWWVLFILIPSLCSLRGAWRSYRKDGSLNEEGRGQMTGGVILMLIAATFIFNWSWGSIWPIFLIIAGISAVLGGLWD